MDKGFDIDFSEIINEEDDSCAFVDSNILESARQELDNRKTYIVERRVEKAVVEPTKIKKEETKYRHKTQLNIKIEKDQNLDQIESPIKHCHHSTIQPVFDCIYCSKNSLVVDNLIQRNLIHKYKNNDPNSLELSIKSKPIENLQATTTIPHNNHSTAVTAMHGRSSSVQKGNEILKFYSLSNSMAKIKLEKQNTLNGTFAQINNMPNIMRSILEKSQLANT